MPSHENRKIILKIMITLKLQKKVKIVKKSQSTNFEHPTQF
ncbi:16492_t:CDS:2 [Funneliformis mosseae]|uniref:16492_t:CDS:1 n=1 Tax=Funneliformis mosseae TaxID=27381 RepID=A0A9N8ZNY5_FUNMO|nr:16492_t:CDS:2 [Funneliformis mosseae]